MLTHLSFVSFVECNDGESQYPILQFPSTDHMMHHRQVIEFQLLRFHPTIPIPRLHLSWLPASIF